MEQNTTPTATEPAAAPVKRKPNRRTVPLLVTMLPDEKARLEAYAQESGRPVTWIVRDGVRAYLDTVEATGELRPAKLSTKLSPSAPVIPRSPGRPPKKRRGPKVEA